MIVNQPIITFQAIVRRCWNPRSTCAFGFHDKAAEAFRARKRATAVGDHLRNRSDNRLLLVFRSVSISAYYLPESGVGRLRTPGRHTTRPPSPSERRPRVR